VYGFTPPLALHTIRSKSPSHQQNIVFQKKKKEKSLEVRRRNGLLGGGGWLIIASSFHCRRDRVRLFGGFPESGWLLACMTLNVTSLLRSLDASFFIHPPPQ
jgi:hypothetical protein